MVFTLGSFVLVTVAVAFVSWLKTKGTDETSKDGYFLGGRSLSGLVIFGSLMMTNLSAEQLVGRNGQGYAAGMTAMVPDRIDADGTVLHPEVFQARHFHYPGISGKPL